MRARFAALLITAIILITFAHPLPGLAQEIQLEEISAAHDLGSFIRFHATLRSSVPVKQALVFYQAQGDTQTQIQNAEVKQLSSQLFELQYQENLANWTPRAFAKILYRFEIELENGETFKSQEDTLVYADDRFTWQSLEEQPFIVYWYQGDLSFAQQVLDIAQAGMERVRSIMDLPTPEKVEIYIYASALAMQETLTQEDKDWVAGHADPDLGVMVVALPPGPDQSLIAEQRIPHELMHILVYQATGSGYRSLPAWLREGLVSIAELYPNPDYQVLLDNARERRGLLPIASLCQTFPRDASNALLAYAQAASFTRYIYRAYGSSGLEELTGAYTNGIACERGPEVALGKNLAQVEREWRQESLGENAVGLAMENLLPWLVVLLAALAAPLALVITRLRWRTTDRLSS